MNRDRFSRVLVHLLAAALLVLVPSLWVGSAFWHARGPTTPIVLLFAASYLVCALALIPGPRTEPQAGLGRVVICGITAFGAAFIILAFAQWRWPSIAGPMFPATIAFSSLGLGLLCLIVLSRIRDAFGWKLLVLVPAVLAAFMAHVAFRWRPKPPPFQEVSYQDSSLYVLKKTTYRKWISDSRARGGAIVPFRDGYLLAGGDGSLSFVRETEDGKALDVRKLGYRLPMNEEEFSRSAREIFKGAWPGNSLHRLRVGDLLVQQLTDDSIRLFASHHVWKKQDNCYVVRVSVLQGREKELLDTSGKLEWRNLFDTSPCLKLNTDDHRGLRFGGLQLGGALGLLGENELLLTVGDHEFDGWTRSVALPQDTSNSYGKILSIRTDTGESAIYSLGHRNPQGLHVDSTGTVWSVEHGPRGGDELNRVKHGANYGWPLVTYGTDYRLHTWPHSAMQGQHEGYEKPVLAFIPSIAVAQLTGVAGESFALWHGDLLIASLFGDVRRVRLEDGRVVLVETIAIGGRVRDIAEGSDGKLAIWTDENDLVFLEPAATGGGESLILQCTSCHTLSAWEESSIGPNLWGVVGRRVGNADDFDYSEGMEAFGGRWTKERLDRFLANPRSAVPGTTMEFEGIADSAQRREIIEYLERLQE